MSTEQQPEGMTELDAADTPAKAPGWLSFAVDFGPLLIFFLVYRYFAPEDDSTTQIADTLNATIYGTGAFMAAIIIAVLISIWKVGKVSPMLWLSAVLILGFGTLTILLNDPVFIQVKPTIIYTFFAVILFGGLLRGKPMLKYLLHAAFEGLSERGWLLLSRNWGIFFAFLAIANEGMRHWLSFDAWLTVKVWGVTAVSFLFTFTQIPMLLRHGLNVNTDEKDGEETP